MNGMYKFQSVCALRNAPAATFAEGGALYSEPSPDPTPEPDVAGAQSQPGCPVQLESQKAGGGGLLRPGHTQPPGQQAKAHLSPEVVCTGTHSKMCTHMLTHTHVHTELGAHTHTQVCTQPVYTCMETRTMACTHPHRALHKYTQ